MMPASEKLSSEDIERKAQDLLVKMSLDEKIAQMTGRLPVFPTLVKMGYAYNKRSYPAGGSRRLDLGEIRFTDGPRGIVLGHATCFPAPLGRGASWDLELETRIGEAIAIEGRALGANLVGAVCVNLLRHPAWGRAQDTYGEDPYHLGEMGAALVRGLQKHVMACVKHYACNSIEDTRMKVDVRIGERTLRELYLPQFKRCIDEGASSVMSAYNRMNGEYCGENSHLLTDVLKNEWGFQGFVMTDFVFGVRDASRGIAAGLDLEMPLRWHYHRNLKKLVRTSQVQEAQIDQAVLRILRQALRYKLAEESERYPADVVASQPHRQLAYESALKSIVLLKNQPPSLQLSIPDQPHDISRLFSFSRQQEPALPGRQRMSYFNGPAGDHSLSEPLLPLDPTCIKRLAVLGKLAYKPNLGDHGSGEVHPSETITPLMGLKEAVKGRFEIVTDDSEVPAPAANLARQSDIAVVVVGNTHEEEGENMVLRGGDRKTLELSQPDMVLIFSVVAANPRTVVVIMGSGPYIIEKWKDFIPAVLMAWYPGMEGGRALADLLLGRANPSGRLPVAFPKSEEHLPEFDNRSAQVEYEYYHGYRLLEKNRHQPAFAFGFGLSYTDFRYQNLKLDQASIPTNGILNFSVDVTNTGGMRGDEVVQVYAGYPCVGIDRPVKELKDFQRLSLEIGETKTVHFELPASRLAYYDEVSRTWTVENGLHWLYVGGSSDPHDLLEATFGVGD